MRLFTAIDLSEDLLLRLERLIAALRPEALIKWSPIDNVHVTTKFIGEWPETRLDELHRNLTMLPPHQPFGVQVKDFGWFPVQGPPRVLWTGVQGGAPLTALIRDLEDAVLPLGIKRETHLYVPHVTLARIQQRMVPLAKLREKLEAMGAAEIGSFAVSRFYLYESQPGSNASLYRKLREYSLEKAVTANGL